MNNVININKAKELKTQAEKIIEKKLTTGEKLSQQEALTILMEMSGVISDMSHTIQQLSFQLRAHEMHITTASAREVALFKLLQEKKELFTEDEFKAAWQEFVIKPMEEKQAQIDEAKAKADKETLEQVTQEAKEASLEAAQVKEETRDVSDSTTVSEPQDKLRTGDVSEVSET